MKGQVALPVRPTVLSEMARFLVLVYIRFIILTMYSNDANDFELGKIKI